MSEPLQIFYRTVHKALPPQSIRMQVPGWAGSPELKMVNGSEPQPWHCLPFVEASTYGLELVYQYETECHIVNDGGIARIEWAAGKDAGQATGLEEFAFVAPDPPLLYSFGTSLD